MAEPPRGRARRRDPEAARTIRDVADRAGVSTATVSRVVNGNYPVAASTRAAVERAMRELGYVANAHARALAGSTTRVVGIVVNEIVDPFFAYIARGVQSEATASGRLCLVCSTQGDEAAELRFVDLLLEQRADAVILVGGAVEDQDYFATIGQRAKQLAKNGSSLVLCGRPGLESGVPAYAVDYDNTGGAAAITDHLLSVGHTKILYLGGPTMLSTTTARVRGFRQAYAARKLEHDPALVRTGAFGRQWGYDQTLRALDEGPEFTAIFAANDIVAAGAYTALRERGLSIPGDISVVGYDDVPVAVELQPALTTVRVPLEELGRAAVRAGVSGQEPNADPFAHQQQVTTLGTVVVVRDSVAPPGRR
ncbi:LacI family DNA-binding transcriptional regulator [Kribbella jejuensis]|uniref:LacI family transcriptional regulator n=1 Tax=Kribbella jejuensis TaxID=236068 RepID=A0A542EB54_9ACTN|nr:LacI family DNA-binding transcriptional regulator [Kribbella jejuensis]TQJ12531.1 LacI family transcriptional regulator [Kribbella jejuensis]